MAGRRAQLPQLSGETFITDGGMETTLVFDDGIDLPHFASFPLLDHESGIEALRAYYTSYVDDRGGARSRDRARYAYLARKPRLG